MSKLNKLKVGETQGHSYHNTSQSNCQENLEKVKSSYASCPHKINSVFFIKKKEPTKKWNGIFKQKKISCQSVIPYPKKSIFLKWRKNLDIFRHTKTENRMCQQLACLKNKHKKIIQADMKRHWTVTQVYTKELRVPVMTRHYKSIFVTSFWHKRQQYQ